MMTYSAKAAVCNLCELAGLLLIGALLGVLLPLLLFTVSYGALRTTAFGLHVRHPVVCAVYSAAMHLGSVYLCLYLPFPPHWIAGLLLFGVAVNCLYAPAETKRRPIPQGQRESLWRRTFLTLTVLILVAILVAFFWPEHMLYSRVIGLAVFWESVNLLPITYKLFREELS